MVKPTYIPYITFKGELRNVYCEYLGEHWQCSNETTVFLINSLAPGKFKCTFRYVIVKWILVIDGWGISCEI